MIADKIKLMFIPLIFMVFFLFCRSADINDGRKKSDSFDYSSPKKTFSSFLDAIRDENVVNASSCWTADGVQEAWRNHIVLSVEYWIYSRKFRKIFADKFGKSQFDLVSTNWIRNDVSDCAINLTRNNLKSARVSFQGNFAEMLIDWDSLEVEVAKDFPFYYSHDSFHFRLTAQGWKLDAARYGGSISPYLTPEADLLVTFQLQGQVLILSDAVDLLKTDRLKSVIDLNNFLDSRMDQLRSKITDEMPW